MSNWEMPQDPYPQVSEIDQIRARLMRECGAAHYDELPEDAKCEFDVLASSAGWEIVEIGGTDE